jgi:branched-subunit amino acid transport protein
VSAGLTLIVGGAILTVLIKSVGPVLLGGRELPIWATSVIMLLPPALLAALVVTQALADGDRIGVGPETAGVAAGGLVVWRTGSVLLCGLTAAVLTAALRAL